MTMKIVPIFIADLNGLINFTGNILAQEKAQTRAQGFLQPSLKDIGIYLGAKITPALIEEPKITVNVDGTKYKYQDNVHLLTQSNYTG